MVGIHDGPQLAICNIDTATGAVLRTEKTVQSLSKHLGFINLISYFIFLGVFTHMCSHTHTHTHAHLHTYPHESDFKKTSTCLPGLRNNLYFDAVE